MDLSDVNLLEGRIVSPGERWILSEGFDVEQDLKSTDRIDAALEDLRQLVDSGAVTAILSHQRRFRTNPQHLDFVAEYLSAQLGRPVKYFPSNTSEEAVSVSLQGKPGSITLFGNTRFSRGEEENDPGLARQFARFGDFVAVGGWCKAHRKNSSNVGILNYLPGFLARSQITEMKLLSPWAGKSERYSVAVVGGVKKEKITEGLVGFVESYDAVIPGGIVLNTVLMVKGIDIGKSIIDDGGKVCDQEVRKVLESENAGKIAIPERIVIAPSLDDYDRRRTISTGESLPEGWMIVDYEMPPVALAALDKLRMESGRLVLAGTPAVYKKGFKVATEAILAYASRGEIQAIALGGDTISDLKGVFRGVCSIGGGASLSYLARGETVCWATLRANKLRCQKSGD